MLHEATATHVRNGEILQTMASYAQSVHQTALAASADAARESVYLADIVEAIRQEEERNDNAERENRNRNANHRDRQ